VKTSNQRRSQRKKDLFARTFHSQERVEWIRALPCALTGLEGQSHNAHTKSRGSGGTYEDIVPLSFRGHRDYDELGEEDFEYRYGTTKAEVKSLAAYYQQLWEEHKKND